MMLIFIVVVFVICHSIRSIINTFEWVQIAMYGEVKNWPDWIEALVHINHFALVVNSSINILIYCCKDEKFLHIMLVMLHLRQRPRDGNRTLRRHCRVVIEECVRKRNGFEGQSKNDCVEMVELRATSRSATALTPIFETPLPRLTLKSR